MRTADLQNLTRRFWRGETDTLSAYCKIPEIVSVEDIKTLSGFTAKTIYVASNREDFPSPVARVKRRLFWRKDDIVHWIAVKKGEAKE